MGSTRRNICPGCDGVPVFKIAIKIASRETVANRGRKFAAIYCTHATRNERELFLA